MESPSEEPRRPVAPLSDTADGRPVSSAERDDMASADGRTLAYDDVLAREKARFGGFKFGAAFFGWLTATGTAVLLTALLAAIGAGVGLNSAGTAADAAAENSIALGIIGAIVLGLVLLISYFAGGYVAGRMARFSGVKQGVAVWIWALVIAIIGAIVSAIAGSQWDILASLDGLPRIPVTPESATLTGILTALAAAAVALIGAILGGMTGMRYHRRIDRVGLLPAAQTARSTQEA